MYNILWTLQDNTFNAPTKLKVFQVFFPCHTLIGNLRNYILRPAIRRMLRIVFSLADQLKPFEAFMILNGTPYISAILFGIARSSANLS